MKPPPWISEVIHHHPSLSMDNEGDRLTLIQALLDAHAKHCPLCHACLVGKTNRTHYAKTTDQTPCQGSWL